MPRPQLQQIVPWGRSFDEYRRMFALGEPDLRRRIVGVADGPASFNAEFAARGGRVVSIDPLYLFSAAQIAQRFEQIVPEVLAAARASADAFVWDDIHSVDHLADVRRQTLLRFLADYPAGRVQGRFLVGGLPNLPVADQAFDLALCSHYLFTYSDLLDEEAHEASIRELCRVAREARIFPVLDMFGGGPSRHLRSVTSRLEAAGFETRIEAVPHEFQRGGNQMLVVRAASVAGQPWPTTQGPAVGAGPAAATCSDCSLGLRERVPEEVKLGRGVFRPCPFHAR